MCGLKPKMLYYIYELRSLQKHLRGALLFAIIMRYCKYKKLKRRRLDSGSVFPKVMGRLVVTVFNLSV